MRKEIEDQKGYIATFSTSQSDIDEKAKLIHEERQFFQQRVSTLENDKLVLARKAEKLQKQKQRLKDKIDGMDAFI
jgi:hypothetical protein